MKLFFSVLLLSLSLAAFSQEKWTTQSGNIGFEASVPLFEEITAENNFVECTVNTKNKTISCIVKIKYFDLKVCAYHKYCFLLRSQINGERIAAWTSVMWKNTEVYLPRIMIGKAIFKRLAIFEMCRPETQLVLWTLTVGLD